MRFTVEIDSDCQSMVDDPVFETQRILYTIIKFVEDGKEDGIVRDSNGNKCGEWFFSG